MTRSGGSPRCGGCADYTTARHPPPAAPQITVSEQPGVQTETVRRGDERLGQGGVPADRVAAQAFSSFNSATLVTVGRDTPDR